MNTAELAKLLQALYAENDGRLKARFDRSLPFQDGLFDRWERADRLGFAKGVSVYGSALVFGDVRVGEQTWIGPYTILDGSAGLLSIGEYCSISSGVHIYTHDTVKWALSGGVAAKKAGPVTIGDRVYIGPQSIVSLGVTVGPRSVVAAQSFVNADVAPGTIVGGTPARRLGVVTGEGHDIAFVFDHQPEASS